MTMTAAAFNKREFEQGRLTSDELALICEYSDPNHLRNNIRDGKLSWEKISQQVALFQKKAKLRPVDGKAGEDTQKEIGLRLPQTSVEVMPITPARPDGKWEPFDGPALRQPRNRTEVYEIFGDPGKYVENKAWTEKNLVWCHEKKGNRLPGVPERWWIGVHRIVEPYLREALQRLLISCPWFVIEVLGSHNWRTIRHRAGGPLSYHSWGIAFDLNSKINFGKDFPKGKAPQMGTKEWDDIWKPDPRRINREVIDVFESCGFRSGADWDEDGLTSDETYVDLMHVEWVDHSDNALRV